MTTDPERAIRQAVILCGGRGTRLGALAGDVPKPMVMVGGQPVLGHAIDRLIADRFTDIVLVAHYRAEAIEQYAARHTASASLTVVVERSPMGTAGALLAAEHRLRERFLVLYGDVFLDAPVAGLWNAHRDGDAATLLVRASDHPADSDLVVADGDGRVAGFLPAGAPRVRAENRANAALYVLTRGLIPLIPRDRPSDVVRDLLPAAIAEGLAIQAHAFGGDGFLRDMGTPERLASVVAYLEEREWIRRARSARRPLRTVFLDRDGVITRDLGLSADPDELRLMPGAAAAIARLNQLGHRVVVVTNQPAVARGAFDLATLERIHDRMRTLLSAEGARVDAVYACPHHPETHHDEGVAELRVACRCRKPEVGLLMRAVRELDVDLSEAVMVGDRAVDVEAARRAGIRSIAVGGNGAVAGADYAFAALPEAVVAIERGVIV